MPQNPTVKRERAIVVKAADGRYRVDTLRPDGTIAVESGSISSEFMAREIADMINARADKAARMDAVRRGVPLRAVAEVSRG